MAQWQIAMLMMLGYLVITLIIGILATKGKSKFSIEEFTKAEGRLNLFLTWFLMGGTLFSAFTFLGAPGWAFSRGAAIFYLVAYSCFAMLPWYVIGPKINRIGRRKNLYSLIGFLEGRYPTKVLGFLIGIIVLFASVQYLATQMKGMAILFEVFTDGYVPFWLGALVAYAIVIIYVATGGVRSAAWTDVFQGILMLCVAWGVGLFVVFKLHDNTSVMFDQINQSHPGFLQIGVEGSAMSAMAYTTLILVSTLGLLIWPHIFSRSYSAKPVTIKKTVVIYPAFAIFVLPVLLVGFSAVGIVSPDQLSSPDEVFPYLITNVLQMPGWLYGIVGAGALAAAMSTAGVLTHSAALEFTDGVIKNIFTNLSERTKLLIIRISIIVIGAFAYLVAVFGGQGLIVLLVGAYGSIVQFFPAVYGALFWRRGTSAGAVSGIIVGSLVNFYYQIISPVTPFDINPGMVGLIANIIVFVVVSYFTTAQPSKIVNEYTETESLQTSSTEEVMSNISTVK